MVHLVTVHQPKLVRDVSAAAASMGAATVRTRVAGLLATLAEPVHRLGRRPPQRRHRLLRLPLRQRPAAGLARGQQPRRGDRHRAGGEQGGALGMAEHEHLPGVEPLRPVGGAGLQRRVQFAPGPQEAVEAQAGGMEQREGRGGVVLEEVDGAVDGEVPLGVEGASGVVGESVAGGGPGADGAAEPAGGDGGELDQDGAGVGAGLPVVGEALQLGVEFVAVLAGEESVPGAEAVLEAVEAGEGGVPGPGTAPRVVAVGLDLRAGGHGGCLWIGCRVVAAPRPARTSRRNRSTRNIIVIAGRIVLRNRGFSRARPASGRAESAARSRPRPSLCPGHPPP